MSVRDKLASMKLFVQGEGLSEGDIEISARQSSAFKKPKLQQKRRYSLSNCGKRDLTLRALGLQFVTANLFNNRLLAIDLSANCLKSLPDEICQISGLKTLDVSSNKLTELPKDLYRLSQLTDLIASNNRLSALPPKVDWL